MFFANIISMKKIILIIILCICLVSCNNMWFLKQKNVTFVFPPFLENLEAPKVCYWKVQIVREGGRAMSESGENEFVVRGESFCLNVEKNECGAILATPIVKNSIGQEIEFFRPAGILFCAISGGEREICDLDWYSGYTSFLLKTLFEQVDKNHHSEKEVWDYIASFNWKKMEQVILEKKSEYENKGSFYNPWLIECASVTKAIANHNFRATLLSMKNYFEMENLNEGKIYSSFVPENKNIEKNCKILIKQSEVNLISDYNLNAIIVSGDSAQKAKIKYCNMPYKTK